MLTEEQKKTLGKELFGYIDQGNLEGVASVLEKDADIDFKFNGKTPIYYASEKGKFEIVKFLLEKGADINLAYARLNNTALYHAAKQGNFEVVKLMLDRGAIINKINGEKINFTKWPHWIAADKGHNNVVKLFLDHIKLNRIQFDSDDITRLFHVAAYNCNEQLVEILLGEEVGADLNKCLSTVMDITNDEYYMDSCDDSQREYHKDLTILLIERGADASKIAEGRFAKELAARLPVGNKAALYGIAIREKDEKLISMIMEKTQDKEELLKTIKEGGMNKEDVTFLLHFASIRGYAELVDTCIKQGGRINSTFGDNKTALVAASESGHAEVVKLLLENNADIYAVAGLFVDTTCIPYWEPHFAAVWEDHSEVVKAFLDHGKVTVRSTGRKGGNTLLHTAARCGSVKVIELLLERGADINVTGKDKNPLYIAVKEGRFEAAETLLKHGAESWWINFNEGRFTPEQVTELSSIKPEKDLVVKNLVAVILDESKRSNKNLSVDQFNMIKIEIENKLQKLLIKNPAQRDIGMAKMLVERDLPKMLVAVEQTKAASNSGLDKKSVATVQKKHVEQTLKAEIKPKKELIVKDLADKIISNFEKNSFMTLPEHVLDIIRVKVQDQLQEQLPEDPSEHQKQAAQEGAQEFVKKIDLQEIMFAYFVSQTQPVKGGVETKEAGTEEPQSDFCSPEVVNADSKKKGLQLR